MVNILFVCHGNICRSPLAEFVLKNMAQEYGVSEKLYIESAATSTEEIGNPVYPPVKRILSGLGIDCSAKRARQIKPEDYERFDLIIGMDSFNKKNMIRFFGGDPQNKIHLMLDFTSEPTDVADPWYTGDFDSTYRDVYNGSIGILKHLKLI